MKKRNCVDEVLNHFFKPDFLNLFGCPLNLDFFKMDVYSKLGEFEESKVKDLAKKNFNKVEIAYYYIFKKLSNSNVIFKKKKRQIDRRHFLYTYYLYTKVCNFKTSFNFFSTFATEMLTTELKEQYFLERVDQFKLFKIKTAFHFYIENIKFFKTIQFAQNLKGFFNREKKPIFFRFYFKKRKNLLCLAFVLNFFKFPFYLRKLK